MKTLLKISWRNIWRNPKRSLVMIFAVTIGLWGGIFAAALSFGLIQQRFITGIEQHISHIQIHQPEFLREGNIDQGIENYPLLLETLLGEEEVAAFSARVVVSSMLATSNLTQGVNILGIDPEQEASTTQLNNRIKEGSYFNSELRNPVLIGKKLADKTKMQEGSRLVLTFQNTEGGLVSAAFRVAGIYQSSNSLFDEMHVYVRQEDISGLLGPFTTVHEVAVVMKNLESVGTFVRQMKEQFQELSVRDWAEVSPEMSYMQEMAGMMLTIILGIILLALAFGLVNTMLMSVFERIREFGMLMAVGMGKKRIFGMILLESTFLTFTGGLGGIAAGFITIQLFGRSGIDLSTVGGDSLNDFGFEPVVYPRLDSSHLITLLILVLLTAIITSVYPALKALRLKPAEAVRKE